MLYCRIANEILWACVVRMSAKEGRGRRRIYLFVKFSELALLLICYPILCVYAFGNDHLTVENYRSISHRITWHVHFTATPTIGSLSTVAGIMGFAHTTVSLCVSPEWHLLVICVGALDAHTIKLLKSFSA